ncbi:hypothetical protein QI140_03580 [Staphylococcus saprophyticus]|nr:hypothetical protein [Staphylococcus saprophyticus]
MEEYINVYIDKINMTIFLSYDSIVYDEETLIAIRSELEKVYGFTVLMIPNAKVTFI